MDDTTNTVTPEDFGLVSLTEKKLKERDEFHARQQEELGFCDEDLWCLDTTIARFILPRLIRFREMPRMGVPGTLSSMEEWNNKLDQMILAFRILDNEGVFSNEEDPIRVECGLKLFAEWFEALWD